MSFAQYCFIEARLAGISMKFASPLRDVKKMHQLAELNKGNQISIFSSDGLCHQIIFSHYKQSPDGVVTIFTEEDQVSICCDATHVVICRGWVKGDTGPVIEMESVVYAH